MLGVPRFCDTVKTVLLRNRGVRPRLAGYHNAAQVRGRDLLDAAVQIHGHHVEEVGAAQRGRGARSLERDRRLEARPLPRRSVRATTGL